jgi:hypothetical protein
MSLVKVCVTCTGCKNKLTRLVEPIHPTAFTNPEEAKIKSFFWCPYCETALGVYYLFESVEGSEETRVVLGSDIDASQWMTPQPATKAITVRPRQKQPRSN